ncbi:MAG: DUF2497 domain-containing protein [Pseudomonadota bacterium]
MAGPHERSSDGSLDDILSSIRRIVADDLDGAERLKARFEDAQQARDARAIAEHQSQPSQQTAPVAPPPDQIVPAVTRTATGTPATTYVEAEQRPSQIEDTLPRDALAPFDRGSAAAPAPRATAPEPAVLETPIVLPTEAEIPTVPAADQVTQPAAPNGHAANGHPQSANGHPAANGTPLNGHAPASDPSQTATSEVPAAPVANGHAHQAMAEEPLTLSVAEIVSAPEPVELETPVAAAPPAPVVERAEPEVDTAAVAEPEVRPAASAETGATSTTALEATVARLLRPMLKDWLDEHMPRLIEQALRDELSKPDGGPGRSL